MKKAKIMLLAIAIIATVGGVLAFKAQKFADRNVYCATFKEGGGITCALTSYKTTPDLIPTTIPCKTWHEAVFGLNAVTTTSYYTTTTCPPPVHSTVYSTIVP